MGTILFLNKAPPYRHTGAEQIVWATATHLADSGWDVHFLCPDSDEPMPETSITFHEVGTPDSFFAEKAAFFLKGIPEFRRVCRRIDPDLIYDNSSPFPFLYAYLFNSHRMVTKVHAVYGLTAFENKDHPITKIGTLVGEQFYRALDGDRMLSISESTKHRLGKLVRSNPNEISVVHNGIEVDQFDYKFSPDGPVLSLCELTPRKNVGMLLRAWAELEQQNLVDRELVIAGDGPRRDELESLASELSLSNVTFRGYVPNEEKIQLFRESFCYVLPTKMEGFGLSNLEAMASGCVVVSTDTPGVRDYLRDGENGRMVPSNDVNALANVLQELFGDPDDAEGLAKAGRVTAQEHDISNTVAHEGTVLEELLARQNE